MAGGVIMLSDSMNSYLSLRRAVGFKLATAETYLQSYVNFATRRGDTHIVGETAIDWATNARSDDARARRLQELIRFARFVRAEDSRHEIPPDHVFCKRVHRRSPYLLTDQEVDRMLQEAGSLGPAGSLRPHTYRTIFGLLASTGLRISEVLRLRFDDMTVDGLAILETKFKKSRLVPLHETVVAALNSYLEHRRRCASTDPHIFVSHRGGGRLHYGIVATTFQKVLSAAGIPDKPSRSMPRLHDLRHRFAVKSLEACPDSRDRITRHMLALSTYLGHARMESTYWYLENTPLLMTDIARACESFIEGEAS
jgi:integrase/recombinase XerD